MKIKNVSGNIPDLDDAKKFSMVLKGQDYGQILSFLWSEAGLNLSSRTKRIFNLIFDGYLQVIDQEAIKPDDEQLKQLCKIKKILILFELELRGYKDSEFLNKVVKKHIKAERPLSDLIQEPFVTSVQIPDTSIPYFTDDLVKAYSQVLSGMVPDEAIKIHSRQLDYIDGSQKGNFLLQYALNGIKSLQVA